MTPPECAFWQRLDDALRTHACELVLIAHHKPQSPLLAPVVRATNGLDSAPADRKPAPDGAATRSLLERERLWRGLECDEAQVEQRRRAISHYRAFYAGALAVARPSLCVIWNGHHPQEMILRSLCERARTPALWLERGPLPTTLHLDSDGVLGGSRIAQEASWRWEHERERQAWRTTLERVERAARERGATWWVQPDRIGAHALRAKLGVDGNTPILLFAGQVDRDVQNLLYAPGFDSNLDAFRWVVEQLKAGGRKVFLLGKQHPKSDTPPEAYREALGDMHGAWLDSAALEDCLSVADRVAAVNSTVLFEALSIQRPALMLGAGLLSDKGVAYPPEEFTAWLDARRWGERMERWRDFGAWLLAHELYSMLAPKDALGMRTAEALGETLAKLAKAAGEPRFEHVKAQEAARVAQDFAPWIEAGVAPAPALAQ
jgi:hypothetical protein